MLNFSISFLVVRLKLISVFLACIILCSISGCLSRKNTITIRNVKITSYRKNGHVWKREYVSLENGSKSICYYSLTGTRYKEHVTTKGTEKDIWVNEHYTDSVFEYDSIGMRWYAAYYRHAIPIQEIFYWSHGGIQSTFEPEDVDSAKAYLDQVTMNLMHMDWLYFYDGHIRKYYQSGGLMSEGNYKDTIPVGIWTYYQESGEIDHRDTIK